MMAVQGVFGGFPPEALGFLRAIDFYQDRAWFLENKPLYESALRAPFKALLTDCAAEFARRGLPVTADPDKGLFRLQRDVRFAKDKRPYKTSAGAVMTRDGRKDNPGLVYIHLDPKGCFLAAGIWMPTPPQLRAMRQHIAADPKAFAAMRDALAARGLGLSGEHTLSRMPRGFEDQAGTPDAAFIRYTSYMTEAPFADEDLARPGLVARIADFTEASLPLLTFFWAALAKATA